MNTRLIASAVFVFAAAAYAQPPVSPCGMLSEAQLKAVLNTPTLAGKPGEMDCTWADPKGGETRVYLQVKPVGPEYKSFRESMQATGKLAPITGLGEDAFYVSATGASAALYVLKAHKLLLVTVDGVGFAKAENQAAERALAGQVLPKL